MTNPPPCAEEPESSGLGKVTISMPKPMLRELRRRARAQGLTVTTSVRRAVSLERMFYEDPCQDVILRHRDTGKEVAIKVV